MPRATGAPDPPTGLPRRDALTNGLPSTGLPPTDLPTTDLPTTDQPMNDLPEVRVSARGAGRLQNGHVWVYRSDVETNPGVAAGAFVRVADHRGQHPGR